MAQWGTLNGLGLKGHKKFVPVNLALLNKFLFSDVSCKRPLSLAFAAVVKSQKSGVLIK